MLDIKIVAVSKMKNKELNSLKEEYLKRLKPYARIKIFELPSFSFSSKNKEAAKDFECEKIEEFLQKEEEKNNNNNYDIYLLAERGKDFSSSRDFANWLNKKNPLILVIGGSLGFTDKMYEKYPQIALSKLTYPHEMARVLLLEQIYRGVTIINKKDYHY
jgi:23S rRNA (pseudouridine1915-N3)-methyltransferase